MSTAQEEQAETSRGPWIKVRVGLASHHKLPKIKEALGLASRREAMGLLIDMWIKTYLNCWRDGVWTPWGVEGFEEIMGWQGEAGKLVSVLKLPEVGVLEEGDGIVVHDWTCEQGRVIKERARPRDGRPNPRIPEQSEVDAAAREDAKRRSKSRRATEA